MAFPSLINENLASSNSFNSFCLFRGSEQNKASGGIVVGTVIGSFNFSFFFLALFHSYSMLAFLAKL